MDCATIKRVCAEAGLRVVLRLRQAAVEVEATDGEIVVYTMIEPTEVSEASLKVAAQNACWRILRALDGDPCSA